MDSIRQPNLHDKLELSPIYLPSLEYPLQKIITKKDFYREENVPGMPLWILSFFHIVQELQINIPTPDINNYNMIETTVERMSSDLIY